MYSTNLWALKFALGMKDDIYTRKKARQGVGYVDILRGYCA